MRRILQIAVCLFSVAAIIHIGTAKAQEGKSVPPFNKYFYLQPNIGLTQYFGDLNKQDFYNKKQKLGYGVVAGFQLSPLFGLRGQFVGGKLYSERESKDLKLNTDFWDAGIQVTVSILDIFKEKPSRPFNLYGFAGPGLTSFTSTLTKFTTDEFVSKSDGRQNEFVIPMGLGVSARLTDHLNLSLEYNDRLLFNDTDLDMFAKIDKRDHYSYTSLGLQVKLGANDRDKDGIKDKKDECPDTPGKIELAGCPDKDNDGIADKYDDCPEVAGKAEFKGCPDTDGDGIPDKDDLCATIAGLKQFNGCPDTDGDGIADKDDRCPDAAGKAEFKGCPDKDGDGVPDIDDECPEIKGIAQFKGCPDADGDGVPDNKDKCPEIAGTIANNGCPEVKEEKPLIEKIVYFDTDKWISISQYNQDLNAIIEMMKDNPGIRISVDGHTDSRESEQYNMKLSERRADYVIKFITKRGIASSRIVKNFYGESRPADTNDTPEGRSMNRRVEIRSIK